MLAETREHLQYIVNEFERACDRMGLKISVEKNKVLVVRKNQRGSCEKIRVSWEEIPKVEKFTYLEVMISIL